MRRRMRWGQLWRQVDPQAAVLVDVLRVLACGPRLAIAKILARGEKSTGEIYDELVKNYGLAMPRSLLYYHLDALEKAGVIETTGYRETEKGGAPEKVWRLKLRRIIIDLTQGSIEFERG